MDYIKVIPLISFVYACIHVIYFHLSNKNKKSPKLLPPGPPSYPLIGNILQLHPSKLHQTLDILSKTFGPMMTIDIGTITTIVISSPKLAKEVLHKNDQALSSRFIPDSVQALSHDKASVIFMSVLSPKWRTFRKVCATKIFSSQQLNYTQNLWSEKIKELVIYLQENCRKGKVVDIGETAFTTVLNSISNTLFSIDLSSYSCSSSQQFRDLIFSVLKEASEPNIADYYPILRRFDPQGARRRMKNYYKRLFTLFESIIEERNCKMTEYSIEGSDDVLDLLLNMTRKENPELTLHDVLHLLLDLFVAGIDTTSATVEWAMAELLHNPEKLIKIRKELKQVLSKDREPKDSDITKLPYLQAIVKETLRMHPAAPIIIRKTVTEIDICNFKVPKDMQVLVNVWSMGRNSSIWRDPDLFLPERFLESGEKFRGEEFGFIPFGTGRKMCPGLPLAQRVVHTMLASLLYNFDWKLPNGQTSETMDMTEKFGVTLHKVTPLMVIPFND